MALGTPVDGGAAYSASGGTSVAPAYPSGIGAGDALVLIVGMKPSTANGGTVTTPSGWTLRDSLTGAGGYGTTLGADTGNTNLWFFTKDTVTGSETGTLSVTIGTNNVSWAAIVLVPTGGGTLSYGSADGSRTTAPTAGTPFSVTMTDGTSATAFQAGDIALWAMCIPTDATTPAQFATQDITATGATFGTPAELEEPDSQTGNDIGGYIAWDEVISGTSSTAPTITVTASGTVTNVRGPIVLLRIRETLNGTGTVTGTTATSSAGTVTATGTSVVNATATVTGTTATSSAATVAAAGDGTGTATGVQAAATAGTAAAAGDAAGTATGAEATSSAGTVTAVGASVVNATATVTGTEATSSAGTVTATATTVVNATATVTGTEAAATAATAGGTGAGTGTTGGAGATGQAGTVTLVVDSTATVAGTGLVSSAGTVTATAGSSINGSATVTGVGLVSSTGLLAATGTASVVVSGAEAATSAGTVTASEVLPVDAEAQTTGRTLTITAGTVTASAMVPSTGGGGVMRPRRRVATSNLAAWAKHSIDARAGVQGVQASATVGQLRVVGGFSGTARVTGTVVYIQPGLALGRVYYDPTDEEIALMLAA